MSCVLHARLAIHHFYPRRQARLAASQWSIDDEKERAATAACRCVMPITELTQVVYGHMVHGHGCEGSCMHAVHRPGDQQVHYLQSLLNALYALLSVYALITKKRLCPGPDLWPDAYIYVHMQCRYRNILSGGWINSSSIFFSYFPLSNRLQLFLSMANIVLTLHMYLLGTRASILYIAMYT